eukprot:m.67924 g.67924  ORF g.67924 m.67924 type:complete len:120 (-) comp11602_c0_seq1:90-449(-)
MKKLKMFRRFYLLVLGYVYVTRVLMYFVANTLPFQLRWLSFLISEIITLIVYTVTGWLFSPSASNSYVQLARDDDDDGNTIEMDSLVSTTAQSEGLRKIRRPRIRGRDDEDELRETLVK